MFWALPESASLVEMASSTGRALRRWDFTARATGVSVIPAAILARVFPVQGATINRSSSFFGPMGSTAGMESRISRPQISVKICRDSADV